MSQATRYTLGKRAIYSWTLISLWLEIRAQESVFCSHRPYLLLFLFKWESSWRTAQTKVPVKHPRLWFVPGSKKIKECNAPLQTCTLWSALCRFNTSSQGSQSVRRVLFCRTHTVSLMWCFPDEKTVVNALRPASTQHWASQRDTAIDLSADHLKNIPPPPKHTHTHMRLHFFCMTWFSYMIQNETRSADTSAFWHGAEQKHITPFQNFAIFLRPAHSFFFFFCLLPFLCWESAGC